MVPMSTTLHAEVPNGEPPALLGEWPEEGGRLDERTIRSLYMDFVGRPPFLAERLRWKSSSQAALAEFLSSSLEFWTNWIEAQMYYFLLVGPFRPTEEEIDRLARPLHEGRQGIMDAVHRICLSASFDRRNPGADTFVTVVMEQLLGLNVAKCQRELQIGRELYKGNKGRFLESFGASQSDVVRIAIMDGRALPFLMSREWERWLRTTPAQGEVESHAKSGLPSKAFVAKVMSWVGSSAYRKRMKTRKPLSSRLFVRGLFVDLLDRLPSPEETQTMCTALDGLADPRPMRSLVARILVDSGQIQLPDLDAIEDKPLWIEEVFLRLVGRVPSPDEESGFIHAMLDPQCKTEMIMYAIVSGAEYWTW